MLCGLFSGCGEWGLLSSYCVLASHCGGFFCCGAWPLSTGSIAVVHRLSRSMARRILPDQGSNLCLLHWQTDFFTLSHQGSLLLNIHYLSSYQYHKYGLMIPVLNGRLLSSMVLIYSDAQIIPDLANGNPFKAGLAFKPISGH